MNTWFVVGSTGLIGHQLVETLERAGEIVYVSSRTNRPGQAHIDLLTGEFADIPQLTSSQRAIAVLAAGVTGFQACADDVELSERVNVVNPTRLSERLAADGWRVVIVSSEAAALGDEPGAPAYASQKLALEEAAGGIDGDVTILRLGKVLSLSRDPVRRFMQDWLTTSQTHAFENLLVSPLHETHAALAIRDLALSPLNGTHSATGADRVSYVQIAQALAGALGWKVSVLPVRANEGTFAYAQVPQHEDADVFDACGVPRPGLADVVAELCTHWSVNPPGDLWELCHGFPGTSSRQ